MRVVLFGSGEFGRRLCSFLNKKGIVPVCFLDNDPSRWGNEVDSVIINKPEIVYDIEFDLLAICVNDPYYDQIYCQLTDEMHLDPEKIVHWTYWQRQEFLQYYEPRLKELSDDAISIYERIKTSDRLSAFNYDFTDEYKGRSECCFDEVHGLYFTLYNGKKMYLPRRYSSKAKAEFYIDSLLMEQDIRSPHRYLDDGFTFDGGCILDAGAAEGIFSLALVEQAESLVLVEADESWNEALRLTFEPWKDKVVIVNKFLSDVDDEDSVTIDSLALDHQFDLIKMDIEGAEVSAMTGGNRFFSCSDKVNLALCVYHNPDDEERLLSYADKYGFDAYTTKGYMIFPDNMSQPVRLVHGVLRLEKK